MNSVFVDTSIQVARCLHSNWAENESFFEDHDPQISDYVKREFMNVVGGGFGIVDRSLANVESTRIGKEMPIDSLNLVIAEILTELTEGKQWISNRKMTIAISIIKEILKNWEFHCCAGSLHGFRRELRIWWRRLRDNDFYVFSRLPYPYDVRIRKSYLEVFECPLANEDNLSCRRGELECRVADVLADSQLRKISRVCDTAGVYTKQTGILGDEKTPHPEGFSIGQKRCFPLGDVFHLHFALSRKTALITSDREMVSAAEELDLKCWRYSPSDGKIYSVS